MVALEDKSISTGFLEASAKEMEERRSLEWNQFYEKELDALQWAKEFMERYEAKRKNKQNRDALHGGRTENSGLVC